MSAREPRARARRRTFAALGLIALAAALVLSGGLGGAPPRAAGQASSAEVTVQTDDAVPASNVHMIGSSPQEAPGETWGIGQVGPQGHQSWTIVRYVEGAGWSRAPMLDAQGAALSTFAPAGESPLAGQITPAGAGALLGTVTAETEVDGQSQKAEREVLLERNPGGDFQEVQPVPQTLMPAGETLFTAGRAPLLAPLDEAGGAAGALVAPDGESGPAVSEDGVLHWDGQRWMREQIEIPGEKAGFRVLAIGASSPANAWLLGQLHEGGVALFRRHGEGRQGEGEASWKPVAPKAGGVPGEELRAEGDPFSVAGEGGEPPSVKAQILTVTDQGVWVDGERAYGKVSAPVTMFFKPEAPDSGQVSATWCDLPAQAPEGAHPCSYGLPGGELPGVTARSFAWADPSTPYGQRVITGLPEDVSLRLEGSLFKRVLGNGAHESGPLGAAFSEPREGWLGDVYQPLHLTLHPAASRLEPYPVPFRFALLAIAPQPAAPVGALSSQALAVGDNGEVARYMPGEGWQPESLLGSGGRRSTARLRAVAWPTSGRAYAVGELGQMWLWRAETGLWEPDPAAPRNFRGNLLGIAFDPNNPTRGFAIGQQGVLLRYGKNWTREALPPEVAGASFTSIAFAGSEAIVAYRIPHLSDNKNDREFYTGGLLVNNGSGWHVDQGAAGAFEAQQIVPWGVAGLPDGGAAICGEAHGGEPAIWERNAAGAAWEPTPVPYPATGYPTPGAKTAAPGSLALFREGGALRVIASGAIPDTKEIDFHPNEPPSAAGLPEVLIKPYPALNGPALRQTASGWRDEENERGESVINPANYSSWDLPYEPDPTAAVLTDPGGSMGWAVGGELETVHEGELDTADIARYPAEATPPPGIGSAAVQGGAGETTFAIAGNAQCAASCAERENDRLGPDLWLSTALAQAGQIGGVRDFLFLGPRLTSGRISGRNVLKPIPYKREFERYAGLLHGGPLPAFPVVSPTDIAAGAGECLFDEAFEDFPQASSRSAEPCSGQSAYYSFDSSGASGPVRVIVLDTANGGPGATQLAWLQAQLQGAAAEAKPAIVLGDADVNAEIAAGEPAATALASVLVKPGGASAYFYDAPEQNIQVTLRAGSESIPAFGTGTLGYALALNAAKPDFIGQSGFLLGEVNARAAARNPRTLRWPVSARLIPNVGELALEGQDGVLLHRSQAALFNGLARRPRAGCLTNESGGGRPHCESTPYIPVPSNCVGVVCAKAIPPEYTFSSSRPDIGDFVEPNLAAADSHAVLLGRNEQPIPDPKSGLFCAYNAGTTVVTISAGGLSSSLTVTVQAGSVRRPCGTVPLKELPLQETSNPSPLAPAPAPASPSPAPANAPPPVPVPPPPSPPPPAAAAPVPAVPAPAPAPAPPPPAARPAQPTPSFFLPPAPPTPLLAFLPPPIPTPARPSPPTGTSAVTSPVEVAQREEEEEEAPESVSNQAVAYRAGDEQPVPAYLLGIIVIAALAGASARRRPRRGRRQARVAPATLTTSRSQRRSAPRSDGNGRVNRW